MAHTVAIVGAGITGLSAAYRLRAEARAQGLDLSCIVLEAEGRAGGKIVTDRENPFVIEGGPDSFVTDKPWGLALCHELGLGAELIPANEQNKAVYILRDGRPLPFPGGFRLTVPTQLGPFLRSPLFTPAGKLRMGMDLVLPRRKDTGDESLASFIRRRLGHEALDRIAGPLLAGIFVSDPERLSMQSAFPRLLAMEQEHGSLIRAARAALRKPRPGGAPRAAGASIFNALRHGMGRLVEVLEERLGDAIRRNTRVAAIGREDGAFVLGLSDGTRLAADQVLIATPAFAAADMLSGLHPGLAARLRAIRYVSTATVSCAYLREDLPPGHAQNSYGVLVPASEPSRILAATWSSTKFRHRAPDDAVLLRVFVGGHRDEAAASLPDAELLALVAREAERLFGITRAPMLHRIFRWPRANPQYDVGHLDRVAELESLAGTLPGLHLAGSAYRGVGLPDCIHAADRAARSILAQIAPRAP